MPHSLPDGAPRRGRTLVLRVSLSTLLLFVAVVVTLWTVGHAPNRQWNTTREMSVRRFPTPDGHGEYSICIVELDDQGVLWDPLQLGWTLEHLQCVVDSSEDGVIVLVFVHGWKQDAAWHDGASGRLALFRQDVERIADRATSGPGDGPPVVGVYVGWRGRSFTVPVLENLTFWNRRVAATRTASVDLLEVLLKVGNISARNDASKIVVMGHSLGGAIVEQALAPALATVVAGGAGSATPVPVTFDLVVLANPASSALDAERLIRFFERNRVRLVTLGPDNGAAVANGPLIASINSEADLVNRVSYPIGMWVNSLVLRYREDHLPGAPSQRRLATRAAGHEPSLITHDARLTGSGEIDLIPRDRAVAGAPYWVIRVPVEISSGHSDVTGPLFGRLMVDLMERNRVFDHDVELALAVDGGSTAQGSQGRARLDPTRLAR